MQRGWFDLKTISNTLLLHPHPAAEAALDVGDRVDVMEHCAGRIVRWRPGRVVAPPGGGPLTVALEGPLGGGGGGGGRAPRLDSTGSEARPLALIVDRDRTSVGSRLTVLESAPIFMAATHWGDSKHRVVVPRSLGALDVLASSQGGAPRPVTLVRKQRFHTLRISLDEVSPLRARVGGGESEGKVCRWQLVLFSRMVEQVVTQQFFRKKATMRVFLEKQLRHKEREPKEDAFPNPGALFSRCAHAPGARGGGALAHLLEAASAHSLLPPFPPSRRPLSPLATPTRADIAKLARRGRESGWEDLLLEEKINLQDMPGATKEILDLSYIEKMQEQLDGIEESWQAYRKGDAVDEGDWWRARLGVCGTQRLDPKVAGAEIEMTVAKGLENNELMVKRLVAKHGWTHIKALGEIQQMRERLTLTDNTQASGHLVLARAMFKLGQLELQCDDLFRRAKATWNAQIEEEAVDTIGGHVTIDVSNPADAQRDGGFRVSFVIEGDVSELCDRLDDFGVGHRFSEDFSSDIIVTALYGRIEEGLKPFQLWGDNNSFDFDAQVRSSFLCLLISFVAHSILLFAYSILLFAQTVLGHGSRRGVGGLRPDVALLRSEGRSRRVHLLPPGRRHQPLPRLLDDRQREQPLLRLRGDTPCGARLPPQVRVYGVHQEHIAVSDVVPAGACAPSTPFLSPSAQTDAAAHTPSVRRSTPRSQAPRPLSGWTNARVPHSCARSAATHLLDPTRALPLPRSARWASAGTTPR